MSPRENEPSPYRFVPLNEVVVPSSVVSDDLSVGDPHPEHLEAKITVDWVPETPFLIGEAKGNNLVEPFQLGDEGPYAIPGASLKGMLRSVMEIVCYGRLTQVNGHHRYGLRDFEHPQYKKRILDGNEVMAGWLIERNGKVFIEESDYHKVDMDTILPFTFDWPKYSLREKYEHVKRVEIDNGEMIVDFTTPERFSFVEDGAVIAKMDKDGEHEGIPVFSGSVTGPGATRKYEYIFVEKENPQEVELDLEIFEIFKINHSKPGKKSREPQGSWATLYPTWDKNKRIPIFYSGDLQKQSPADFCFGLTRLFKIPHAYSVDEILRREGAGAHFRWPASRPDIVEALFGFVYEDNDRPELADRDMQKGRIAFGFAVCKERNGITQRPDLPTVMMGPRASFSPYYLAGKHLDYSDIEARLAGRKRYPVRYPQEMLNAAEPSIRTKLAGTANGANFEMQSRLSYLLPSSKLVFSGDIRLRNVHPVELGAVLWTISLGNIDLEKNNYRHNLGRGKPFGMGQIRVANIKLTVDPYSNDKYCEEQIKLQGHYVQLFEEYMKSKIPDWPEGLTEFLKMCDPEIGFEMLNNNKLGYLGDHKKHAELKRDRHQDEKNAGKGTSYVPERLLELP